VVVEGERVCTATDPNTHARGLNTYTHTYQADGGKAEEDLAQIDDNDDDEADAEGEFEDDDDLLDDAASGADEDNERVDEGAFAELRPDEEKIMDRALAALDHISESGGFEFAFDKRTFFKTNLLQWRRQKDQTTGKWRTDLKFASAKESVGGGRTQTGKTALEAALAILAKLCEVTVVVVTTTRDNQKDICKKLVSIFGYLTGQFEACRPLCTTITKQRGDKDHLNLLNRCITQNGVIVVNLTKASVNKVRTKIQEVRGSNVAVGFALVKDEGESVISTSMHLVCHVTSV
jgi:hypothetical protein